MKSLVAVLTLWLTLSPIIENAQSQEGVPGVFFETGQCLLEDTQEELVEIGTPSTTTSPLSVQPAILRGDWPNLPIGFSLVGSCSVGTLRWPLYRPLSLSQIILPFGADWINSCGGAIKRHTGIDHQATKGEAVLAAAYGVVKAAFTDAVWGGWVTLEHSSGCYTTSYWHIIPSVGVGSKVSQGQQIGRVADLGSQTHFHFGIRGSGYSNISNRGGLPRTTCGGDPAFPSYFENPLNFSYWW